MSEIETCYQCSGRKKLFSASICSQMNPRGEYTCPVCKGKGKALPPAHRRKPAPSGGEIERNARLLCKLRWNEIAEIAETVGHLEDELQSAWDASIILARGLAAAGLTLAPIEPDEATVNEMAAAILEKVPEGYGMTLHEARDYARAAYRAGIGREE